VTACRTDHASLAAARRAMEQAEALLEVARRERWPGIEVSAGYQQFEEGDSDAVAVGVSLALPLWDRRTGEQDAWKARIARAAADLEQAVRRSLPPTWRRPAKTPTTPAPPSTLLNDSELPLARSVADAATKSYEAGATGLLDLLDALDRLAEAESRRIEWSARILGCRRRPVHLA
jgi:cobalt-zinc-cadmium efflux system outer membrane protein